MAARTVGTVRTYRCHGPDRHEFRTLIWSGANGTEFKPVGGEHWLPVPKCPVVGCRFLASDSTSSTADHTYVRESERFLAWLSPDGKLLPVPGTRDARMPERYRQAGYSIVEAHTIQDIDCFDSIRARQTGNRAYNEVNYDASSREYRQDYIPRDYDSDDSMTTDN